jgi:hypothetical protein
VIALVAEDAMRVELTIDGGFAYIPGRVRPIAVEGARLVAGDAALLRLLCQTTLAATRRHAIAQPAVMPDARRYRLTIEIDGQTHELTAADPVSEPEIAALIDFVTTHGAR